MWLGKELLWHQNAVWVVYAFCFVQTSRKITLWSNVTIKTANLVSLLQKSNITSSLKPSIDHPFFYRNWNCFIDSSMGKVGSGICRKTSTSASLNETSRLRWSSLTKVSTTGTVLHFSTTCHLTVYCLYVTLCSKRCFTLPQLVTLLCIVYMSHFAVNGASLCHHLSPYCVLSICHTLQ